jgi:hypothetical protein
MAESFRRTLSEGKKQFVPAAFALLEMGRRVDVI